MVVHLKNTSESPSANPRIIIRYAHDYIPVLVLILLLTSASFPTVETSLVGKAQTAAISTYVNSTAVIETNYGTIRFMLYDQGAPITTTNFIKLADSEFYDGCLFHRVIDDFVIQGGDPNSKEDDNPYNDGMGGSSETIPLEINPELTHVDGAVGMARSSDPDSASSQFYICDGAQHQLDGNYSVFGVVNDDASMDVVRTIASVETWGYVRPLLQDRPVDDVVMEKVYTEHGYYENVTASIPPKSHIPDVSAITVIMIVIAAAICYKTRLFRRLKGMV